LGIELFRCCCALLGSGSVRLHYFVHLVDGGIDLSDSLVLLATGRSYLRYQPIDLPNLFHDLYQPRSHLVADLHPLGGLTDSAFNLRSKNLGVII